MQEEHGQAGHERAGTRSHLLYRDEEEVAKEAWQRGQREKEARQKRGGSQGQGGEAVVRRYHGRLQGRGALGLGLRNCFVVALWLRQRKQMV